MTPEEAWFRSRHLGNPRYVVSNRAMGIPWFRPAPRPSGEGRGRGRRRCPIPSTPGLREECHYRENADQMRRCCRARHVQQRFLEWSRRRSPKRRQPNLTRGWRVSSRLLLVSGEETRTVHDFVDAHGNPVTLLTGRGSAMTRPTTTLALPFSLLESGAHGESLKLGPAARSTFTTMGYSAGLVLTMSGAP